MAYAIKNIHGIEISKSQVTVTPPGNVARFALIGRNSNLDVLHYNKRQQFGIYYEMWKQHPIVRAAIDKKATYAIAGGFQFISEDPKEKVSDDKVKRLKLFFRRSSAKQLLRQTYKDLDIFGESFWLIQRSAAAQRTPMKAVRLNPRFVNPRVNGDGQIVAWRYGPLTPQEDPIEYPADVVLHFRKPATLTTEDGSDRHCRYGLHVVILREQRADRRYLRCQAQRR
jgi:hypothetical protein